MNYPYFSISFEKIACFEDRQNLSLDQKITLITGPNNSGKTVLLNQIKNAWLSAPSARPAGNPMAFFTDVISEQDERNAIQAGRYTLAPSQSLINKLISFPLVLQNNIEAEINIGKIKCDGVNLDALNKQSNERNSSGLTFYDFLISQKIAQMVAYHQNIELRELDTQRMVLPSTGSSTNFSQDSATALTRHLITDANGDETIVQKTILDALNEILGEESFSEMTIKSSGGQWEITLFDQKRHRSVLSQCGTGLHTIVLVLLALYAPRKKPDGDCLFLFDELENNLHPAIVRRLFQHIIKYSQTHNDHFAITSHSPIAINVFGREKESVSLYRIIRNTENHTSNIEKVSEFQDKIQSVEDLGAQASDLFQSNGLVWVEGPSDRIYIKHWLELADPTLIENVHYQFIYYGGRLLAHYTAETRENFISMLKTNNHSAVIMDSDKANEADTTNDTKQRIVDEFKSLSSCLTYVTPGREIENEIPPSVYAEYGSPLDRYEEIDAIAKKALGTETFDKIAFAKMIVPNITLENMNGSDNALKSSFIDPLAKLIRKWNGMN